MAFAFTNQSSDSVENRAPAFTGAKGVLSSDKSRSANRGASAQYQKAQVETASPTGLVVMLYDGAIRFCCTAQDALKKRDLETQNLNLIRAQRIVGELISSLNREAGGEVASNLFRIYTHMLEELVKANLYDDAEAIGHVVSVMRDLRESWVDIDRLTTQETDPAPGSVPAANAGPPKALMATTLQNKLASKTSRLLEAQRSAAGDAGASRLGDRSA